MSNEPPREPIVADVDWMSGFGTSLNSQLLAKMNGDVVPLPDENMLERDGQRIAVVMHELFGITPEHWSRLSEVEQEPWLERALDRVCVTDTDDDQSEPTVDCLAEPAVDCPVEPSVDCPAKLQSYLGLEFTAAEIAYMVHRAPGSIKRQHKLDWGKPDVPSAGRLPAKWKLWRILPTLKKQFDVDIQPPKASIEDD